MVCIDLVRIGWGALWAVTFFGSLAALARVMLGGR